jgi:hypothetical protein
MPIAPQKITFAEMRVTGVTGVLVYCSDHRCSHSKRLEADRWPTTCGYPISSLDSCERLAAAAAPMSGRTGKSV